MIRTAAAFLKRDFRVEKSYRFSFVFEMFGIFFSVFLFYFLARVFGAAAAPFLQAYGGDYFSFVLIGIAFSGYFTVGLSGFTSSIREAQTTGTMEAMLMSPTPVSTIILSSAAWDYALTTMRVLVYLAFGVAFLGVDLSRGNYGVGLLVLALTVVAFSSLGVLAASFVIVLKRGDPVTWLAGSFSSLVGGVYYPIDVLPGWLQPLSRLLPLTYALDALRRALLAGASLADLIPDLIALTAFGLVLLPISLFAFRHAVQRAKIDGSLTQY